MNTKRLDIKNQNYDRSIAEAAAILKNGGIVGIPKETVYGLAASAYSDEAIVKVFEAKGRPQDNPLIVHISDMDMLDSVATDIPQSAYICAERFWPGPFTMILKRSDRISESVSRGLDTVAVRMPSDRIARDIIKKAGPLAAPSANRSGSPSPTSPQHVLSDLEGRIDAVVMAGECEVGVESTVVSLVTEPVRLLRPGAVTAEQLREIFPYLAVDKAVLQNPEKDERVSSPGMKYKHYAPKTTVYLVEGEREDYAKLVNSKENAVAICFDEDKDYITAPKLCYGSAKDEATLAHSIFEILREVDSLGVDAAYVHAPSKTGIGLAVYNRLIRAAAFRVIKL